MAIVDHVTFDFILANELKRAVRSQNFVTLAMIEPRSDDRRSAAEEIARLVESELRETDLLAVDGDAVWIVLLDADLLNSTRVINRVVSIDHYGFTGPLDIDVGAACCPTHGADAGTLKRAAAAARTRVAQSMSEGAARVRSRVR